MKTTKNNVSEVLSQITSGGNNKTTTTKAAAATRHLFSFLPFYTVLNIYETCRNQASSDLTPAADLLLVQRTLCALSTKIALAVWENSGQAEEGANFNAFITQFGYGVAYRYPNITNLKEVDLSEISEYAEVVAVGSEEILEIWDRVNDIDISNLMGPIAARKAA